MSDKIETNQKSKRLQGLLNEQTDISKKIHEIEEFCKTDELRKLGETDQILLGAQCGLLEQLRAVIACRIDLDLVE